MKGLILLFALYFFCQTRVDAQTMPGFFGAVLDSASQEPLIGATVQIEELQRGTFTDVNGKFEFKNLRPGRYTCQIRYLGYFGKSLELDLTSDISRKIELVPTALQLPEFLVTEDRTKTSASSQSVTVLTPAELDRHRGQTLGETLESVPGVTLLQTGPSISKPVIRGMHSQRVLIVNGGIAQEGQQWGGEHAPEIDPFAPEKIQVLKGAAGVEYGSGAIGGVIRIEPRPLRETDGVDGEMTLNAFSNNRQGAASIMAQGRHSWLPHIAWRAQGSYRKAGDSHTPDYNLGNTGFRELNGSATVGYSDGAFSSEVTASHFGTELGIYRGSHVGNYDDLLRAITTGAPPAVYPFTYAINAPKQEITHDTWSLLSTYRIQDAGQFRLQFGWQSNHRQEFDAHRRWFDTASATGTPSFDLLLTTYSLDLKFKHDPVANIYGTIGISGLRQTNVGNSTTFLIPNFRAYSGGMYLLENWSYHSLDLNAGVRLDYHSTHIYPYEQKNIPDTTRETTNLSGALGAVFHFSAAWSIAGNIGMAWRRPSVNELYSNGVHHGTAQYEIGDPFLKDERGLSMDITVRYKDENLHCEISAFNNMMTNYIFVQPDPNPTVTLRGVFPTFRYRQTDALLDGMDGTVDYRISDLYRIGATLSIVRGKESGSGKALYQIPADHFRLLNHFDLPGFFGLENPFFEAGIVFVRKQDRVPSGFDYLEPPAGYALFDLDLGGEFQVAQHFVHFSLSAKNVFNVRYRDFMSRFRYYIDDPGRDIALRIQIPFGAM